MSEQNTSVIGSMYSLSRSSVESDSTVFCERILKIKMLLYWGMFTVGFLFGSVLAFITFAPKKPEDDPEYGERQIRDFEDLPGAIEGKKYTPEMFFPQNLEKSVSQKAAFNKKGSESRKIFLTN